MVGVNEIIFDERCTNCNKNLHGRYYCDLWGRKYCAGCGSIDESCRTCGSPIVTVEYPDHRRYCQRCEHESIKSSRRIDGELLQTIRRVMERRGFHIYPDEIKIKLYKDRRNLSDKTHVVGIASHQRFSDKIEIKLLVGGNPLISTMNTLSHEVGHCWAYQHSSGEYFDQPLSEAIADFFSLTVLSNLSNIPTSQEKFVDHSIESLKENTDASTIKNIFMEMGHPTLINLLKRELKGKAWCAIPLKHNRSSDRVNVRIREIER